MVLNIQSPTSGVLLLIFSVQKLTFFFLETQDENQYPVLLYLKLGSLQQGHWDMASWKLLSRRAEEPAIWLLSLIPSGWKRWTPPSWLRISRWQQHSHFLSPPQPLPLQDPFPPNILFWKILILQKSWEYDKINLYIPYLVLDNILPNKYSLDKLLLCYISICS